MTSWKSHKGRRESVCRHSSRPHICATVRKVSGERVASSALTGVIRVATFTGSCLHRAGGFLTIYYDNFIAVGDPVVIDQLLRRFKRNGRAMNVELKQEDGETFHRYD